MKSKLKMVMLAAGLMALAGWLCLQYFNGLVTLNVRNMEVREVVRKIERQTRQTIIVHTNVQGKVTINVRRVPLEEALKIVSFQTASSWSAIYPLYSKKRSLGQLERGLRGEIEAADHGWTNLQSRFFPGGPGMFGGPSGPGGGGDAAPQRISLQIANKDVAFTTLAFNRFAQLRIVPEDGTAGLINLDLKAVKPAKAVAKFASQAKRDWTRLYVLRGQFGPGGPGGPFGGMAGGPRAGGAPGGPPPQLERGTNNPAGMGFGGFAALTPEQREEMRKQRENLEIELMKTLPAAERQRLEQAQQERMREFEEMRNMTPEERRARFAQRGGPGGGMDRMMRERIKYTTPEQQAESNRRMLQMRQRMQQNPPGGQPGQPGPGQPPAPNR